MRSPVEIFIAEIEAFGGAERSMLALSRWLAEHRIPNRILTYRDRVGLEEYALHPVEVLQLAPAGGARVKLSALRRHLSSSRSASRLMVSGYQPALHATLAGARGFHCVMHDTPVLFGDVATRGLKSHLRLAVSNVVIGHGLRSGGATVVTSEFLKAECRKDFDVQAEIARMGGVSRAEQFRERRVDGRVTLLSVSRVESNKRIDWMLQSLAELETGPAPLSASCDWQLRIVGKGSQMEALRRQADALGVGQRVDFLGFVTDEQLRAEMDAAHLFLMPAVQGFGIPAVEALQAGIPVLLHRESGVSDILLETPWATVFEGGPEAMEPALRAALEKLLRGDHLRQPLPPIPTEDEWAARVAGLCGWA